MNVRRIAQWTSAAAFLAVVALAAVCLFRLRAEWITAAIALLAFSVVQLSTESFGTTGDLLRRSFIGRWLPSLNFPFCKTWANMSNRVKLSIALFVFGLSLAVAGVATESHALTSAGLFTIAVTVRYRKRPPFWDYLAFLVLAPVTVALVPPSSPLIGAIPLMLSYVLDYIDEQRQKRAALSTAALAPETTPAELSAVPNGGSAAPVENMKLTEGPPLVS